MARTRPLAALAGALAALALPAGAVANPIPVDTTTDDGAGCSLREAIRSANQDSAIGGCAAGSGADEITLPASATPYSLTVTGTKENGSLTGDLDVGGDVTIKGAGADTTTIDGNGTD